MDAQFIFHLLNGLLMIGMPIILVFILIRKWNLPARIWWIGVATFIISQAGHIPFNSGMSKLLNQTGMVAWDPKYQLIFNAVFVGLSAGLFEEVSRYLVLRLWLKDARSWQSGVLFGAGHGGAEAIILGGLALYALFQMVVLRNADLSKMFPANQIALATEQVRTYWTMSWYASMLGALERFFTIPTQIALAVIVMQVFIRRNFGWLFAAIGYHALIDGIAVFGQRYMGTVQLEGIVGIFAILSLLIIILLRKSGTLTEHQEISP